VLERIIRISFAHPALVILLVAAGAAAGGISLRELRRDVLPDLSAPVFNVIVQNAAMGAKELEIGMAIPLEAALTGLPGVRRVRSNNQLGVSQVTVEFEPDADYYQSRQFVAERLAQVAPRLPAGSEPPLISSLTGRLNEIMEISLSADPGAADLMTLRDYADFDLRNRLQAVPGVAAVERLGGFLRQFQVQLDPERLSARGVSLDAVMHAVEGANENAPGGFIVQGPMEWSVLGVGRIASIDDLRTTVVALRGGTPVLLGDVADVREAPAPRRGVAHRLSGEVVQARVIKQFGADTTRVAAGVRRALADLQRSLPPGVQVDLIYDQSVLIDTALAGVGRAVLVGAVLVVLVLITLLGNLRAALVVTVSIPLSVALAGVPLRWLGIGLNTMTLGGLAIAVGLLVDASIIVTENIVHRLSRWDGAGSPREQALLATLEVARPIAFATFIVIAVFLPIFGLSGIEGRMYRPLAGAVVCCVGASLVLALTMTPALAALVLRPRQHARRPDVWLVRQTKALYAPLLDACLRRAALVRALTLSITLPALALAFVVGSDFVPKLDEGALMIQTTLPPEASLAEVDRLNHRVEDVLRTFPDVEEVFRRTGRSEETEDPMPHTLSDVLVVLRSNRVRSLDDLTEAMRDSLERIPGVSALFTTPLGMRIDEGLAGTPSDIAVRIFGPDLDELAHLAERSRTIMSTVEGITDLRVEPVTGLPQLRISVDRGAAARVGLTPGDVLRTVRTALVGTTVSEVWIGQRRYDLVVKLQEHHRNDLNSVRSLLIDGHDGTRIPLGQLARIEQATGPVSIRREAGGRRIAVEASVTGRDLGSVAAEVRQRMREELDLPSGYFFDVGGRVESQARAVQSLAFSVGLAVLAVFVLLTMALGSTAEALVILATLPDAFVGGIAALLLAGETWNVSSLVGLIGLFGIAVQNGLVLVAQTRSLLAEGKTFTEALREASIGRVRPKLMTTATAILGLLPLLVLRLHGTEIERPLAIVMIGGLLTSMLFTLLALPTFYALVQQLRERFASRSD
jgi:cobalt-zinc-cadmium resistance protein CzcA